MSDLKAQIEENNLLRQLEREKLIQEENKRVLLMEKQQEKEMQIKKELEAEYQKRALELEKREQHAKLLYDKLQKDPTVGRHGTLDLQHVFRETDESCVDSASTAEGEGVSEKPIQKLSDHSFGSSLAKLEKNTPNSNPDRSENSSPQETCTEEVHAPQLSPVSSPKEMQSDIDNYRVKSVAGQRSNDLPSVYIPDSVSLPKEYSLTKSVADGDDKIFSQTSDVFQRTPAKTKHSSEAERHRKRRRSWHEHMTDKAAGDVDGVLMSPSGILFSSGSGTYLKSRGISAHGHASDSTIQHILYKAVPNQMSYMNRPKDDSEPKGHNPVEGKNIEAVTSDMSEQDVISNVENDYIFTQHSAVESKSTGSINFSKNNKSSTDIVEEPSSEIVGASEKSANSSVQSVVPEAIKVIGGSPLLTHNHMYKKGGSSGDHECDPELRSFVSQTVLKHRGKNVHGHSSDSTIQHVMYNQNVSGKSSALVSSVAEPLGVTSKHDHKAQKMEAEDVKNRDKMSNYLKFSQCDGDKVVEISPDVVKNCGSDSHDIEGLTDICNNVMKETPKNSLPDCSEATKTLPASIQSDNSGLVSDSYSPTYCQNYSILDKQPLPGLMTNIPKSSANLASQEDEDISNCHYTPLLALINRSLLPVIQAQIKLVNKSTMDYFIMNLNINDHFMALRNFFFFHDGEFGHSLSQILFDKMSQRHSPVELLNPFTLNTILSQALSMSLQGDTAYADRLSFAVKSVPFAVLHTAPNILSCIKLTYKVEWPCNIVITEKNMVYYNSVLELLLQVKRCHWSLTDVWFHFKRDAKCHKLDFSPQYRQLQIYRHEMLHFARVMQSYIASQVLQVTWKEFQNVLDHKVNSLDDLREAHASYLKKACYRCLLSKKAAPVMKIIKEVLSSILKYRSLLLKYDWILNSYSGHLEHPAFVSLVTSYKTFHDHSCFLYKVLRQLVLKGYQPHLKDFLAKLDFNDFYGRTVIDCDDVTADLLS